MKQTSPILVAGATSIHGWALTRIAHSRPRIPVCNQHVRGSFCRDWIRVNAEDTDGWLHALKETGADTLIYCAGVCHVEQCEKNPAWARRLNVTALEHLLERVPRDIRLVYISSDHVFAGRSTAYTEEDLPEPISLYGRLRAEAEGLILKHRPDALSIRPGLCIGPSAGGRTGHWDSLKYRVQKKLPVTIIEEEFRTAVWADDAAARILAWCDSGDTGIRHITATRPTERPELAAAICRARGLPERLTLRHRTDLASQHLGRVELGSMHNTPPLADLPQRLETLYPRLEPAVP